MIKSRDDASADDSKDPLASADSAPNETTEEAFAGDLEPPSNPTTPSDPEPSAASEPSTDSEPSADSEPARDPEPAAQTVEFGVPPVFQELGAEAAKHPWGIAARCLTLSAALGLSLFLWAQFGFKGRWIADFIISNQLEMPLRMRLMQRMFLALAAGGAVGLGVLLYTKRRGIAAERVERWLWFLSPLGFLGVVPVFLRFLPWRDRHEALLPALLLIILAFEACLLRAMVAMPARASAELAEIAKRIPGWCKRYGAQAVVIGGTLFYAVFMSFFMVRWHQKLGTGNFDLSINNNLLYGGLKGVFMHSTVVFPDDPAKYLSNHVKLGGYLLLPVYAIFPRAETLLIAQSTFLACGALPLFGFARRYVGQWTAMVIALAWLCYYPMHSANCYEVNYVPMAAPFIIAVVWAADTRRWLWCGVFFLVAALMREDVPVGLTVVGLFLLLSGHRPIAGLSMAVIAASWFVYLRFHVMEQAGEWWFPEMYKELWAPGEQGFKSVIKTLITNPLFTFQTMLIERKFFYLLHLLVPIAFLPARRWYLWAAFIPGGILSFLATSYKPPTMFSFQYVMHWAPYLFLAVPLALRAIAHDHRLGWVRARAALAALGLATIVTSYNYGAFARRDTLRAGYVPFNFEYTDEERKRYADLKELIRFIPQEASVGASEKIGPHVSSRSYFYSLRRGTYGADYLIAREKELKLDRTRFHVGEALKSGKYGVWKRSGEFALIKKGYDTAGNEQLIQEWAL